MDNYRLSRDRAQAYFLNFDQETLIRTWNLKHNADSLYVPFLHLEYQVCRQTGRVLRPDGTEAGYSEVLSIFDLLCHEGENKRLSGRWAPVNSLDGLRGTAGVGTDFHESISAVFDRDPAAFRATCEALGGEAVAFGDIGYRFSVFGDFSVILKFYHSDEEFPAATTLLWDANTLQFIFYETVFYIAGFLLHTIAGAMEHPE